MVVAIVGSLAVAGCITALGSGEREPSATSPADASAADRPDPTNLTVEKNLTGAKVFQFTFEAPTPTECEVTRLVVTDRSDAEHNGTTALVTIDQNGSFDGWMLFGSPPTVQAHAGGYRVKTPASVNGTWVQNATSLPIDVHGEMRITAVSEKWILPDDAAPDHTLELTFDCDDAISSPTNRRVAENVRLLDHHEARGGAGMTSSSILKVNANVHDQGTYEGSRPVDLRAGGLCWTVGDGTITVEGPNATHEWTLGNVRDPDGPVPFITGYRYSATGPPGSYDWTVDFAGRDCGWWLAAWPQPAAG